MVECRGGALNTQNCHGALNTQQPHMDYDHTPLALGHHRLFIHHGEKFKLWDNEPGQKIEHLTIRLYGALLLGQVIGDSRPLRV